MEERIAVITGASSGIGRITAVTLAKNGHNLVLASRSQKSLGEVAAECTAYGVDVLVRATDATKEDQVKRLAMEAVDHYGAFDIWINNAGVTALGAFEEIPPKVFAQVMETNYMGCVYGSKAALKQFKVQQYGTLINLSSVFGAVGSPYESPYVASKFAVRGLSQAIRSELDLDGFPDIHICTMLPYSINTPLYRNAANYTGQQVVPIKPVYPARQVADAILSLIERPVPEVYVGATGHLLSAGHALLPVNWFESGFARFSARRHFSDDPAPLTEGNLSQPSRTTSISGNWPEGPEIRQFVLAGAAALGAGLAIYLMLRRVNRGSGDA